MLRFKRLFSTAIFILLISVAFSQSIEITPVIGYQFGATVDAYRQSTQTYGEVRFVPDMNYGAAINVGLPLRGTRIEFMWTRQDTKAQWRALITEEIDDVVVEYFMLSGWKEVEYGQLVPFGGFTVGAVNVAAQSSNDAETRMAVGLGGGLKYFVSDKVGIRAHARFLMPVQWFSGGFTIGTGGAGVGVGASSTIFSGDVGGGLVIRLGQSE